MRSLRTTTKSSPHSPQLEKARMQQQRPNTAKNNKLINLKNNNNNFYFQMGLALLNDAFNIFRAFSHIH